jgi:hypothetical protein
MTETTFSSVSGRIGRLDWDDLERQLDDRGFAVTEPVLSDGECVELAELFEGERFRSTIDMARHRFGDGRYRYFAHPLPDVIQAARVVFYERAGAGREPLGRLAFGRKPDIPGGA